MLRGVSAVMADGYNQFFVSLECLPKTLIECTPCKI